MEFIITTGFLKIQDYFEKKYDWNLVNNFIALYHASSSAFFGFIYLFYLKDETIKNFLIKNSTGYFLYDICNVIERRKINVVTLFYIYHHIVTIYFIHLPEMIYNNILFIYLAETSNIPSYFTYYCIKKNSKYLDVCKYIQFIIYTFFRLPVISYFFYITIVRNHNTIAYLNILPLLPIYFMAFIWSRSLYLKL